jgi:hypothetical protein
MRGRAYSGSLQKTSLGEHHLFFETCTRIAHGFEFSPIRAVVQGLCDVHRLTGLRILRLGLLFPTQLSDEFWPTSSHQATSFRWLWKSKNDVRFMHVVTTTCTRHHKINKISEGILQIMVTEYLAHDRVVGVQ